MGILQVLVIRRHCTTGKGGAERYCANLCRGLRDLGHEVILIGESCEDELLSVVEFVQIRPLKFGSATKNWSFHLRAQEKICAFPGAISIALSRTYPVDVYRLTERLHAYNIARRYTSSYMKLWTRLSFRHRVLVRLEKGLFSSRGSRAVITISELDKKLLQQYYCVSPDRIHVVYNGVDTELFNPVVRNRRWELREALGIEPQTTCYLFPAMDFKKKGLRNLLVGLSRLSFPWILLVVGEGKVKPYKKLARILGIENRVRFLGKRKDINFLYGAADLMVFPAEYEPFGSVNLEALACGLPVLTTEEVGGSEVVEPFKTGYVIDRGSNIEALVNALRYHEQKRPDWEMMSKMAAKSVEQFTLERNAREVEGILLRVSSGRLRAPAP